MDKQLVVQVEQWMDGWMDVTVDREVGAWVDECAD